MLLARSSFVSRFTEPMRPKVVHVYDDIEEEDNHLPHWWLGILFGAIVFGFGYWFI